jgi:hypothetical protein
VARVAQRAVQGIVVVDVAVGAQPWWHSMRSGQWEPGGGVVKFAVGPKHGVVAALARSGEMRADVVHRSECCVVVVLVASDASRASEIVVSAGMAIATLPRRHGVRSCESESGRRVIKLPVGP